MEARRKLLSNFFFWKKLDVVVVTSVIFNDLVYQDFTLVFIKHVPRKKKFTWDTHIIRNRYLFSFLLTGKGKTLC